MAGQVVSVVIELQNKNKTFNAGVRDAIFHTTGMQFQTEGDGEVTPHSCVV